MTTKYRKPYNPELHFNHGKPWTVQDLAFMCSRWEKMRKEDIALTLGRTHQTVLSKADKLRVSGDFEIYKKIGQKGG
jgi:hypothetical protein